MEPFTVLTAVAVPIEQRNVNTDMLFPARYMRKPRDADFPLYLFHDRRFRPDGTENPDFALNRPPYRAARIIVGNSNFGCGSSRETAVYALHDYGCCLSGCPKTTWRRCARSRRNNPESSSPSICRPRP